jgi:hypothetical protein
MQIVAQGETWKEAKKKCASGLYGWGPTDEHQEGVWTLWDPEFVDDVSKESQVEQTMSLGTVFAMTLRDPEGGE